MGAYSRRFPPPRDEALTTRCRTRHHSNEIRNIVAQTKPGTTARLTLVRDGRERSATATLDELPAAEVRR
jgi:hypothetical protein